MVQAAGASGRGAWHLLFYKLSIAPIAVFSIICMDVLLAMFSPMARSFSRSTEVVSIYPLGLCVYLIQIQVM